MNECVLERRASNPGGLHKAGKSLDNVDEQACRRGARGVGRHLDPHGRTDGRGRDGKVFCDGSGETRGIMRLERHHLAADGRLEFFRRAQGGEAAVVEDGHPSQVSASSMR